IFEYIEAFYHHCRAQKRLGSLAPIQSLPQWTQQNLQFSSQYFVRFSVDDPKSPIQVFLHELAHLS
ncbi:MAG: hypothetical protein PHE09_20010, partial [Oscillospiraceae bacterium]|nr:hypothetical protein [Oscillospiraceae bacterium]